LAYVCAVKAPKVIDCGTAFTFWISAGDDTDPPKLTSPLYVAVIEFEPPPRVLVLRVAIPPTNGLVPRIVEPLSLKVTVPVGVPPVLVTVDEKVSDVP